jgi:hypothetical protein
MGVDPLPEVMLEEHLTTVLSSSKETPPPLADRELRAFVIVSYLF